jgi:hypothetical protein
MDPVQLILQTLVSYVLAPISLIIMVILAIIKWRESKSNPYNIVLVLFFLFLIAGLLANVAYAVTIEMDLETVAFFSARLAAFLLAIAMVFPLYFLLALLKSFKGIDKKQTFLFFVAWIALYSGLLFIGEIYLDENFVARWSLPLIIWDLIANLILIITVLYYSKKVYDSFEDKIVKKRFLLFIIAYILIGWMMVAVVLVKVDLISSILSVGSIGIGMLVAPTMIYLGIGKKAQSRVN